MKHLRLFENTEKANNQVVDLPVVALVQGVENGLVMAPKTEEASAATISVSEDGNVSIAVNINEDDLTKGEFIDLGLSVKWASCNLGAEKPCEYGHYYMWGSVEPNTYTVCDWAHAPFNNGSSDFDETYFDSVKDTVCPNGILANKYDAAKKVLGGKAHMPTQADFDELLANTTSEWCNCTYLGDDHTSHTVMGRKFTSKSNGNSIFIPASGYRRGSSFFGQGSYSDVWSSSLLAGGPLSAWYLYFGSSSCYMNYYNRYYGFAVRPVSE